MTRSIPIVFVAALAACTPSVGSLDQEVGGTKTTVAPISRLPTKAPPAARPDAVPPVRFGYMLRGSVSADELAYSSAADAYARGDSRRRFECGESRRCIDETSVAVFVKVEGNQSEAFRDHGYEAMTPALKRATNAVVAYMLDESHHVKGTDYEATLLRLEANARAWGDWAQADIDRVADVVERIEDKRDEIVAQGEAIHGAEHRALAEKRGKIERAEAVINAYRDRIGAYRERYASLGTAFLAYRDGEPAVGDALAALIRRGNEADLEGFGAIHADLDQLAREELNAPQEMMEETRAIARGLEEAEAIFVGEIAEHLPFLDAEGVAVPELTGTTLGYLARMLDYFDARIQRVNYRAMQIAQRLSQRRAALILGRADQATQETVRAAARARASAEYLGQVNEQIGALWAAEPRYGGVELLSARYERILALEQTETVCAPESRPLWMADGCEALARERARAAGYLDFSLGFVLRGDVRTFRDRGLSVEAVDALEASMRLDDVARTLFLHDNLARALGGAE